jgi:hypothetical protein
VDCGGTFDRAARLLAFAFRFFLDGSLGHVHIVGDAFKDGGRVIPKNPSGQSSAGAESFCEPLPFANYLVDVGPNEFRKSHPSFPSEVHRAGISFWICFNVTLTANDTAL